MRRVLILHGWTNVRPPGHWQRRLAAACRTRGDCVSYPQLPDTDLPVLDRWHEVLRAELDLLAEVGGDGSSADAGETVVVAHSLGCVLWISAAAAGDLPGVDRVLLVAPPDPDLLAEIPDFRIDLADPRLRPALAGAARSTILLGGDDDPWTPRGLGQTYAEPLGLPLVTIPGAAHLALSDGWGPWQGVIDWVADPAADLSVR